MSGKPTNQETGIPGGTIDLDVYFRTYIGGDLVDPDSDPTWEIYDPSNVLQASGTGTKVSLGYYQTTWSIPSDATVSSSWKIEWTATVNGASISNEEYFIVATSGQIEFGGSITITDNDLDLIKLVLAFPSVDNVILTDDQIKSLCVWPAMIEYFTRFPIKVTEDYSITTGNETEVDFPDNVTYGCCDVRIVDKDSTTGGSSSSFWDLWAYQQQSSSIRYSGQYGIRGYNPSGLRQITSLRRNEMATESNRGTVKYRIDEVNRKIYIYTSIGGVINITWAKWSNDFSDIKFVYHQDAIKLAQANLLAQFAATTQIVDAGGDVTINYGEISSLANQYRSEVIEKWEQIPSIIALRMS